MPLQTIRMTRLVSSPIYGNCAPGELIKCDSDFAKHCVDTLNSAVYLKIKDDSQQAKVRVRRRG